jgi:hypothetical protein
MLESTGSWPIGPATHGELIRRAPGQHAAAPPIAPPVPAQEQEPAQANTKLRQVFDEFVGQTFFSQMLSAMRETQNKPAYFHGGRMEEAFQAQLDQVLAEKMAEASASQFTEPMFNLFNMTRR